MDKQFVQVACDVHIDWAGTEPTAYRLYVNDELFTERQWCWPGCYLEEIIQLEVSPGKYRIVYELVEPNRGCLTVSNMRVIMGPGKFKNVNVLKVI